MSILRKEVCYSYNNIKVKVENGTCLGAHKIKFWNFLGK